MKSLLKSLLILACLVSSVVAAEAPLNVVVVLDGSGSMDRNMDGGVKMDVAKQSLLDVLKTIPPNSKVGILCFSSNAAGWIYPLQTLKYDSASLAINQINAGGGTPLGQYMQAGADALLEQRKKERYGMYRLLAVTDGDATDDARTPLIGENGILSKGITVNVIGVNMAADHELAKLVPYRNATDPQALKTAIAAVFAETPTGLGNKEDFEMVAGLNPAVATSILKALATYDNAPVGQKTVAEQPEQPIPTSTLPVTPPSESMSGGAIFGIMVASVIGFLLVVGLLCWIYNKLTEY